ncbi:MAG: pilus assembly PilX family protein [Oceanobacter sp.]
MLRKHSGIITQRGSVLVLSIAILSLITFGAVLTMKRSTLQVRMTNNMQFHMDAFNSAMDSLVVLESNVGEGTATDSLSVLVALEEADDSDLGVVDIDLYDLEEWDTPVFSNAKVIDSVSNRVSIGRLPDETSEFDLKTTSGSSINSFRNYTFIVNSVARDKSGNIVSTQQIAIDYPIPAT